jgi:hypothetical protein
VNDSAHTQDSAEPANPRLAEVLGQALADWQHTLRLCLIVLTPTPVAFAIIILVAILR